MIALKHRAACPQTQGGAVKPYCWGLRRPGLLWLDALVVDRWISYMWSCSENAVAEITRLMMRMLSGILPVVLQYGMMFES